MMPLSNGSLQVSAAWVLPGVAVSPAGLDGSAKMTIMASLVGLVPTSFVARIRKLYSASFVRPVTVWEVALVSPAVLSGTPVQSET